MSQAKVDQYKKEKAGRKTRIAHQKVINRIAQVVGCVIVIALVCFIGYKGYQHYESTRPANTYYADLTSLEEYIGGLDN